MAADVACDQCGKKPAPIRVDSAIGLALWNRWHPDDQRSALWFCSDECTFWNGYGLGDRLEQEVRQKDRDRRQRERENGGKEG
jgi:hypothetical protein